MKRFRTIAAVIAVAFFMLALSSCGQSGTSEGSSEAASFDPAQIKTMGEFLEFASEGNYQEAYTESQYVYAIDIDGTYYRAVADLPEDVSRALWDIDFEDEDKDQKVRDLVSSLELASLENLSEGAPSQADLDKLAGMKGQELFDDGWSYNYYNLEDMEAGMDKGPYSYIVKFDYDGEQMENSDDFDFYEEFKDLTVSSVTYEGIGNASYTD